MNRQLTGVLADLHFAPTEQAARHLLQENKKEEAIFVTGNTAIDALKTTVRKDYEHPVLDKTHGDRVVLVTAHRRENLGERMRGMFRAIKRLVNEHGDIQVIYPVHLNPVVQEAAQSILGNDERIHLIKPLGALDFHNFAARSHLILTDSGGVQEEAPVTRNSRSRPARYDRKTGRDRSGDIEIGRNE